MSYKTFWGIDSNANFFSYTKEYSCIDILEKIKTKRAESSIEKFKILSAASDIFTNVYLKIEKNTQESEAPFLYMFIVWIQERNPLSNLYKIRQLYRSILQEYDQEESTIDTILKKINKVSPKDYLRKTAEFFSADDAQYKSITSYELTMDVTRIPLALFKLKGLEEFSTHSLEAKMCNELQDRAAFQSLKEIVYSVNPQLKNIFKYEVDKWVSYKRIFQEVDQSLEKY